MTPSPQVLWIVQGGPETVASGVNPKNDVVDEDVELEEEDGGQITGISSGVASLEHFLTLEGYS